MLFIKKIQGKIKKNPKQWVYANFVYKAENIAQMLEDKENRLRWFQEYKNDTFMVLMLLTSLCFSTSTEYIAQPCDASLERIRFQIM